MAEMKRRTPRSSADKAQASQGTDHANHDGGVSAFLRIFDEELKRKFAVQEGSKKVCRDALELIVRKQYSLAGAGSMAAINLLLPFWMAEEPKQDPVTQRAQAGVER